MVQKTDLQFINTHIEKNRFRVVWCCRRALKGGRLGFRESNVSVML